MRKFVFILTTLALVVAAGNRQGATLEIAGRAEILTGKVTVERAEGQQTLMAGGPVFVKDRILTGPQSSAQIVFGDESRIKLAADTSFEITGYQYYPAQKIRHALISLASGKARFFVQDLQEFNEQGFRIRTQTAIVASRDTDFIVSYDPQLPKDEVCRKGLTNAFCLKNSIIVYSLAFQDKPVILTANMISQVCGPNPPSPPRFITPAELARIQAGLDRTGNSGSNPYGFTVCCFPVKPKLGSPGCTLPVAIIDLQDGCPLDERYSCPFRSKL